MQLGKWWEGVAYNRDALFIYGLWTGLTVIHVSLALRDQSQAAAFACRFTCDIELLVLVAS